MYISDGRHGVNVANVGANGALDVNISDQTSPILMIPLNKVNNETTITSDVAIGDKTIVVDTATGFIAGALIIIADPTDARYYIGHQVGAIATKTVTLDTPLDFAYESGTRITAGTEEMAVDGSSTTQVFSLRAGEPTPGIPIVVDVTDIIITCLCTDPVSLATFGDQAALSKGLVMRRTDGIYNNLFNVKTNRDIATIMDWTPYVATKPSEGVDGFVGKLSLAGAANLGVAIRVGTGEDLESLVQDDLSITITSLKIMILGHVVVPN